ncbi:MAG: hypothetical protein RL190_1928 [Actinomycetota bacterium]
MRHRGQAAALGLALAAPLGLVALIALAGLGLEARRAQALRIAEGRALQAVADGAERATAVVDGGDAALRVGRHRLALPVAARAVAVARVDEDGRRIPVIAP